MAKKKKVEQSINNTYEFYTLDKENIKAALSKVDDYYRKNGRTVVGE